MNSVDFQHKRVAVLSDVNANWEALDAVIRDVKDNQVDQLVFLGDAIGYGPNPSECFTWLRRHADVYLIGRLECQMLGKKIGWTIDPNRSIRRSIDWSRAQLEKGETSSDAVSWLRERDHMLRQGNIVAANTANYWDCKSIVYGNINGPAFSMYKNAVGGFGILLIGDNHAAWGQIEGQEPFLPADVGARFVAEDNASMIACVGSVGQPRDRDPRASYLIVSGKSLEWRRVAYDVETTARKIRSTPELHQRFAERLQIGV